jgi:hypothetical protein
MKLLALLLVSLAVLAGVFWAAGQVASTAPRTTLAGVSMATPVTASAAISEPRLPQPPEVCFAPGTSDEYMAEVQRRIWGDRTPLDYFLSSRWSTTATDGFTGSQGEPITLTYSFIPDGTTISDNWGSASSQLFSRMNTLFGSPAVWQAKFAQAFGEWARLAGIHYVQVSDDGSVFPDAGGQLGSRGDVRIGCKTLDGASGVLAYDYYPDGGDMVLDASENWGTTSQDFIFFRNIITHEHGHGLGLEHVCPANSTKLLEPYYTPTFDGPQHDDIRAGQRNYGDHWEPNNAVATATNLGTVTQDSTLANVSIDHQADEDWYSFTVQAGNGLSLTLDPVGYSYLNGPQNSDGSCTDGTLINSLDDANLNLYLYNSAGSSILAQSISQPVGVSERIFRYPVPAGGGSYKVKVTATGSDAIQLYRVQFGIYNRNDPFLSVAPLDFDTTTQYVPVTRVIYLVNPASGPRQVTALNTAGPFTITPSAPFSIPALDSVALSVTYGADQLGQQTGSLTVTHDGPAGTLTCGLTGAAIGVRFTVVGMDTVNIGDVPVGGIDSLRVPIRALGNVPLVISVVVASPHFSLGLHLPDTLGPSQTRFIYPRFAPVSVGNFLGTLVFEHNGLGSPDTILVQGRGVPSAAVPDGPVLPRVFRLAQNYPNPFNPTTRIGFDLPCTTRVTVQIFDVQGREVRRLVDDVLSAGSHTVTFDGTSLSSGIYFCRMTSPQFHAIEKMALIK